MTVAAARPLALDTDRQAAYYELAKEFFEQILGLDFDSVPLTSGVTLDDFAFAGFYGPLLDGVENLDQAHELWDFWALELIQRRFGIHLENTELRMTEVLEKIMDAKQSPFRLH